MEPVQVIERVCLEKGPPYFDLFLGELVCQFAKGLAQRKGALTPEPLFPLRRYAFPRSAPDSLALTSEKASISAPSASA